MFMLIPASILGIIGAIRQLNLPPEQRRPGFSLFATWSILLICVGLLALNTIWALGLVIESSQEPPKAYINGIPVSRSDYEACHGRLPEGCPPNIIARYLTHPR